MFCKTRILSRNPNLAAPKLHNIKCGGVGKSETEILQRRLSNAKATVTMSRPRDFDS